MNESKATRYQRLKRRAHAVGAVSGGVMLAVVAWPPIALRLARLSLGFASGLSGLALTFVSLALFVLLVVILWELAALPAVLYVALRLEGTYGQSAPSVEEALAAQAHATAVALVGAFGAGAVVLVSVRVAGPWWWALAGLLLALALAAALRGAPAVLARLAEIRPLTRPQLGDRLSALARRARVPVRSISEWIVAEPAPSSALVTGAGRSRRVLLTSDVVRSWSDDEIVVVVAHELAHHAYRDLWRTLALDALILSASLFLADAIVRAIAPALDSGGAADLAALPAIAFVAGVVWTIATPLRHAQSRRHERRADVFALALTGGADAFGAAVRRLGARRLSEERPSVLTRWLFFRHPSVAERLALADAYRAAQEEKEKVRGSKGPGVQGAS